MEWSEYESGRQVLKGFCGATVEPRFNERDENCLISVGWPTKRICFVRNRFSNETHVTHSECVLTMWMDISSNNFWESVHTSSIII